MATGKCRRVLSRDCYTRHCFCIWFNCFPQTYAYLEYVSGPSWTGAGTLTQVLSENHVWNRRLGGEAWKGDWKIGTCRHLKIADPTRDKRYTASRWQQTPQEWDTDLVICTFGSYLLSCHLSGVGFVDSMEPEAPDTCATKWCWFSKKQKTCFPKTGDAFAV